MFRKALFACIAVAVALPTVADAKRPPRPRVRLAPPLHGSSQHGANVLSATALQSCVQLQGAIDAGAAALDDKEGRLVAAKDDLRRRGEELDQRKPFVDVYSQASVDSYNALVQRYEAARADFNTQLEPFNADVDRHNAKLGDWNAQCAGRSYRQSDMDALRASR